MQRILGRDSRGGRRRWLAAAFLAALAAGACNAFGHWFAPEHDARYVELHANLLHFRTRYERILADRKAVEPTLSDAAFRERYYAYLDRELRDVEAQLAAVGAAQRAAAPQHLGDARGTGVLGR